MGDLRDQLKKARILSDKEARRLEHEARVTRKEKGRQGLEQERQQREAELAKLQGEQRQQTRRTQAERDRERLRQEELAACRDILARETRGTGPGNIRWYFQLDDGQLPWFEVTDQELRMLQSGMLSVARQGAAGTHVYGVLSTDLARRVVKAMPEVIVWAPRGVRGGSGQ